TGSKKPRIPYSTTYSKSVLRAFPALSVAVHVTVFGPAVLESTAPQLDEATPDAGSTAFGDAVTPAWATARGEALRVGLRVGAVRSTLNETETSGGSVVPFVVRLAAYTVWIPSEPTDVRPHGSGGSSPKLAGTDAGSSAQRVSAPAP